MATAKQLKKLRETTKAIQAEQASKPKAIAPKAVATIKVDGKVIGQMKSITVPTVTRVLGRAYQHQTSSPTGTARNMGLNPRTKSRNSIYNKIK